MDGETYQPPNMDDLPRKWPQNCGLLGASFHHRMSGFKLLKKKRDALKAKFQAGNSIQKVPALPIISWGSLSNFLDLQKLSITCHKPPN
jgi:hypothetical protein